MDKVAKALQNLSAKEKAAVKEILLKIKDNSFLGTDLKKLKSRQDLFRIRKGKLRIIFRKNDNGEYFILAIERRSDKTYSGF